MKIVYLESNEYLVLSNLNFARSYRSSSTLNSVFLSLQTSGDRAAKIVEVIQYIKREKRVDKV